MPRSRRAARTQDPAQGPSGAVDEKSGGIGNQAAQNQQGGGPMGWFRQAGSWMGDKVGAATEAVGQWAGDAKQAAQDAWDVATSTSVGMEDGTVYIETDLDELADLMSAETRAALALDRASADNRVRISYDRASGQLVATCDELALTGIQTDKLQADAVVLRTVRAVFTNSGGKIPGLGENFSLFGYKDAADNLQAVVTIADAEATGVSFAGPNGQTEVASVKLTGMTGTVGAEGGMPFSDAGTTEVDFALEHAVLQGLSAEGHAIASAEVSGLSGGMSEGKESAFLAADSVAVSSVAKGDQQVAGASSLSGLRVDVENSSGGLLGLDDKPDQACARVAVEAARVSQLDTDDFDASSVSAKGLSGTFDNTNGVGGLQARSLGVDGLDTSWVDATRLQADQLSIGGDLRGEDGRRDIDLDVGTLSGDGLRVDKPETESATPGMGGLPLDWSADIGAMDLKDTVAGGASIDRSQLNDARLKGVIDGARSMASAEAKRAELTGFAHEAMTADRLSTTNTSISANHAGTGFSADHVSASNLATENLRAGELNAYGGTASLGGGSATASLDRARMVDATVAGRIDMKEAQVDQLHATADADGRRVMASGGTVTGVSDRVSGARMASGTFDGAALGVDTSGTNAHLKLGEVGVSGVSHGDTTLQSGTVTGVSASRANGVDQVGVDRLQTAGLAHGDTRVAHLHAGDITGRRDAQGLTAKAGRASARQIDVGDTASIATAGFTDLAASHSDAGSQASIGTTALGGVDFQTANAQGRIHSVDVQGASASRDAKGGLQAGADGVQLRDLSASGRASGGGGGAPSGLDTARLVETGAAQLRNADVSAQATLPGGDLGVAGLKAARNTQVEAGVSVRNGQIQDQGTHARFDKRIDGPLWTSVSGAYVRDGKLRADVNGWGDKNITDMVNESLGVSGRRLPSTAAIGTGLANQMRSGTSSSDTSSMIDKDSIRVDGSAQFGSGVIDAGVGQVDLARGQQVSDNRIDFKAQDGGLEAEIQRFLADSAAYSSGGTSASTGPMSVSGAAVDAKDGGWKATADAVDLSNVRSSRQ